MMDSASTTDIEVQFDSETSSSSVPIDLLHAITPLEAFQLNSQNKMKRGKAYNNMVRVVPIHRRSEDRERPISSIMQQRSCSIGIDGPKPTPPPYTSARTPEAGILLTFGERICRFINPRRENRPSSSKMSLRSRAHSTDGKSAFSKLFRQETDPGEESMVTRITNHEVLLAAPTSFDFAPPSSDNPLPEPTRRGESSKSTIKGTVMASLTQAQKERTVQMDNAIPTEFDFHRYPLLS